MWETRGVWKLKTIRKCLVSVDKEKHGWRPEKSREKGEFYESKKEEILRNVKNIAKNVLKALDFLN